MDCTPTKGVGTLKKGDAMQSWTTYDEKIFLDHLGEGKWSKALLPDRKVLLERYLASMDDRSDWGGINKEEVRKYVRQLLSEED